jgi:tetratricopeptide (TPR) repeat protein
MGRASGRAYSQRCGIVGAGPCAAADQEEFMRNIKSLVFVSLAAAVLAAGVVGGAVVLLPGPAAAMGPAEPSVGKSRNYTEGERAVKAKEYAKAIPLLERALNDNMRDADANNLLGYSHRKLGNTQVALTYYQRALQIDANHRGANEYLGELYVELNDLPKAKERLAKLTQLCGTSCEEYRDLKAMIDKSEASGGAAPKTGT